MIVTSFKSLAELGSVSLSSYGCGFRETLLQALPWCSSIERSLSPVAPVPASHLRCCILSYPAAGISTLLQVLQFLCHAWAVRSTQDVSFCLPDFRDKSVIILSIILFYAMHYFSLISFFFNSIFDFQLCDYHMLGCSSHRI